MPSHLFSNHFGVMKEIKQIKCNYVLFDNIIPEILDKFRHFLKVRKSKKEKGFYWNF